MEGKWKKKTDWVAQQNESKKAAKALWSRIQDLKFEIHRLEELHDEAQARVREAEDSLEALT